MESFFLDSSALAKRYLEEPGTARVVQITEGSYRLCVSRLAWVEVASAVVRHANEGKLGERLRTEILDCLRADFEGRFDVVELTAPVLLRSVALVESYGLRAGDAIQLACALAAAEAAGNDSLTLVSTDYELNAAGDSVGLRILDPAKS